MTTEKWVQCTEELAENPHKVKAWRLSVDKNEVRFLAYDKGHIRPIIIRFSIGIFPVTSCDFHELECLIEVPIQERFVTFYEGDKSAGAGSLYPSLEFAKEIKASDCTHILKLTYDGEKFQAEPVWTKEST